MTTRLLLVDGTNIVMRCAFGGEIPPERAVPTALNMIDRTARQVGAEFLVLAFDHPAPTWRKALDPAYKAHREGRTVDVGAFVAAAIAAAGARQWHCEQAEGFEADDVIATIADRVAERRGGDAVAIFSGDSDALACLALGARVFSPRSGAAGFTETNAADVRVRYGVEPWQLPHFKAIAGEPGDNVEGLGGRTPKGHIAKRDAVAAKLLASFRDVEGVIAAGAENASKEARTAYLLRDRLRLSLRLTDLRTDVPLAPIAPASCYVGAAREGAA